MAGKATAPTADRTQRGAGISIPGRRVARSRLRCAASCGTACPSRGHRALTGSRRRQGSGRHSNGHGRSPSVGRERELGRHPCRPTSAPTSTRTDLPAVSARGSARGDRSRRRPRCRMAPHEVRFAGRFAIRGVFPRTSGSPLRRNPSGRPQRERALIPGVERDDQIGLSQGGSQFLSLGCPGLR
jgi:hypothetical protein